MSDEMNRLLHMRGVDEPCSVCHGFGTRQYSSTATWHGGVGGAAMTVDVCDTCWGTGDEFRHGADLRAASLQRRQWEDSQCLQYFARKIGCTLSMTHDHMIAIAEILEREERRRKTPFDHDNGGFWWRGTLKMVASGIRSIVGSGEESNS